MLLAKVLPLLVAPALCSPAAPSRTHLLPSRDLAVLEKPANKELAVVPAENADISDFGSFALTWLVLGALYLPYNPWTILFGMYNLARSTMDIYKDCKDGVHLDCILHGVDAVVSAAYGVYKVRSGIKREAIDGRTVFATSQFGGDREVHAHVAVLNGSLKSASVRSANNGTWELHATFLRSGQATHHLMYRTAHADDLGFANDGSYHHYRVQPTSEYSAHLLQARVEDKSNNLVTDYLWKDQ
ncbi:hypothetical protein AURDEDRAFT_148042 [Auricularia subglabra TFB-10046 SS5]|nr:hypothetical protein AURDEDRAFT_148042 [Auricularia subglabra TFB-10046 SS5]